MSGLLADLFPYIVAFYLADALALVRPRQVAFVSTPGGHRRVRQGLHVLGIFPWTELVAVDQDPVLLLSRGLGVFDSRTRYSPRVLEPSDFEVIPWGEVGEVRVSGRRVVAGKRTLCIAMTRASARAVATRVARVREASPEQRDSEIARLLDSTSDLGGLLALRGRTRPLRRAIALAAALLFGLVFVLLPSALFTPLALGVPLRLLLVAIVATAVTAAALGAALAWRCGVREELAQELLPLILFAPGAARSLAQLSRGLFCQFDIATVAAALLPRDAFIQYAREELNRIRLGQERADATLATWLAARRTVWERVLDAAGLALDEVLAAPRPTEPASRAYCPLCSSEYRAGFERCGECDARLEPLSPLALAATDSP